MKGKANKSTPDRKRRQEKTEFQHSNGLIPTDEDGALYHIGLKRGEIHQRIITVGDRKRALTIARHFDDAAEPLKSIENVIHGGKSKFDHPKILVRIASRGYLTISGAYQGIPVSVVAIGMGFPMMDFFLREVVAIVQGPLHVIRFGSCGTVRSGIPAGSFSLISRAALVLRQPDYFTKALEKTISNSRKSGKGNELKPYTISQAIYPDKNLTEKLEEKLKDAVLQSEQNIKIVDGLNVTCDSFYSSQGRTEFGFTDFNTNLLRDIKRKYSDFSTIEMETFHLFHLAQCYMPPAEGSSSKRQKRTSRATPTTGDQGNSSKIHVAAMKMILVNRADNAILVDQSRKAVLETIGGKACLEALVTI